MASRRRTAAGGAGDGGAEPGTERAGDGAGDGEGAGAHDEVRGNRVFILLMGLAVIVIAIALNNVVEALTLAYNVLVGGLLVPILGGLLWKRGTAAGALASVAVGGLTVVALMVSLGVLANEPIYYGLITSLVAYVVVSLCTRPTDPAVLDAWRARIAGRADGGRASASSAAAEAGPEAEADDEPEGDTAGAVAMELKPPFAVRRA